MHCAANIGLMKSINFVLLICKKDVLNSRGVSYDAAQLLCQYRTTEFTAVKYLCAKRTS